MAIKFAEEFPKDLNRTDIFPTPVWSAQAPEHIKQLNKYSDPYIVASKKHFKPMIDKRNKEYGNKKDMGHVFHSTTLIQDENFMAFHQYVTLTSRNLLIEMGYDLSKFDVTLTESWVQEFAKAGGGHHTLHTHWNGHISGFYFLNASECTSKPVFHDPRPGHAMNGLPLKSTTEITYGSPEVHYKVKPGTLIFFPSYLPHLFSVDVGYEPFRFIHWNVQAIPKPNKIGV
tara:strand:+ start:724 stop:1410 length:687 start_codon:yes stop_codon:yes gene_type:complete